MLFLFFRNGFYDPSNDTPNPVAFAFNYYTEFSNKVYFDWRNFLLPHTEHFLYACAYAQAMVVFNSHLWMIATFMRAHTPKRW
ncbi:hypothetical protein VIAG107301_20530 [Vibrio agarivorans]